MPEAAGLRESYVQWLATNVDAAKVRGFRVLIDCANGASAAVAPELFRQCGVEAGFLHVSPDGRNINAGCGALHPEHVAAEVRDSAGAFDLRNHLRRRLRPRAVFRRARQRGRTATA